MYRPSPIKYLSKKINVYVTLHFALKNNLQNINVNIELYVSTILNNNLVCRKKRQPRNGIV